MAKKAAPVLDSLALSLIEEVCKRLSEREVQEHTSYQTAHRTYHGQADEGAQRINGHILSAYREMVAALIDENKKRSR